MVIRKRYERLVNLGNYENVKVSVELENEFKCKDAESVRKAGMILGKLAKSIIDNEIKQIKDDEELKKSEHKEEESNG